MNSELLLNRQKTDRIESISLLRVIGMFSIVGCHLFGFLNIVALNQFLNFGVYLFLFISGFLYANKNITNCKKWYVGRCKKLLVPYYVFTIPIMVIYYCNNPIDIFEIIKYIFCLQGVQFITNIIPFSEITTLGNLWFVTIIMLCYLIMMPIKKLENNHNFSKSLVILFLLLAFILPKCLMIFQLKYVTLDYFVVFFLGYYTARWNFRNSFKKFIIMGVFLLIFSVLVRLLGKYLFDESNQMLYQVLVSFSHPAIAVSFFYIIDFLTRKYKFLKVISNSSLWQLLDKYSYFIYITHCAFLNDITSVSNFGFSTIITILLFAIFTVVSAILIKWANDLIQRRI